MWLYVIRGDQAWCLESLSQLSTYPKKQQVTEDYWKNSWVLETLLIVTLVVTSETSSEIW